MEPLFKKGNLDSWKYMITQYLPQAINTIENEVDNTIATALVALLGDSSFHRDTGKIRFDYDMGGIPRQIFVELLYMIPALRVPNATPEAIRADTQFIEQYLSQLKVELHDFILDNGKGQLYVKFALKVGF